MRKTRKKLLVTALVVFVITLLFPACGFAMSPPNLTVEVLNAPDNLAYLDILIPDDTPGANDKNVSTELMEEYPEKILLALAGLRKDGYKSFSLSFNQAEDLGRDSYSGTTWVYSKVYTGSLTSVKIVTMDNEGEILKITDAIPITPSRSEATAIHYDFKSNTVKVEYPPDSLAQAFFGVFAFAAIGVLISILSLAICIKVLVALPFKVTPFGRVPIITLITQTAAVIAAFLLKMVLPLAAAIAVAVLVMITAEYLAYKKAVTQPRGRKLLLFVLVANSIMVAIALAVLFAQYGNLLS